MASFFGPGELSAIHLNFSTPYPRKKDAELRLTDWRRLVEWRGLLADGAELRLKTDSRPFFDFSLEMLDAAGYGITWSTDEGAALPDEPVTEYEERLTELGAEVFALGAVPVREPGSEPERKSLYDYLPADLSELGYVPYGMGPAVENLRNFQRIRGIADWHGALR